MSPTAPLLAFVLLALTGVHALGFPPVEPRMTDLHGASRSPIRAKPISASTRARDPPARGRRTAELGSSRPLSSSLRPRTPATPVIPPISSNLPHGAVRYEFEGGLDGWGNATAEQVGAELTSFGGELRGEITAATVALDSPRFVIPVTDRTTLVLRMAYLGTATRGLFMIRTGAAEPPVGYARGDARWSAVESLARDGNRTAAQWVREFAVVGDGAYRTYYIPLFGARAPRPSPLGNLTQLRLHPVWSPTGVVPGATFQIDFLRVMEAPTLLRVSGCGRVTPHAEALGTTLPLALPRPPFAPWVRPAGTFADQSFAHASNVTIVRGLGSDNTSLTYGITYNCLRGGGDFITLRGTHFGLEGARVLIDGRACTHLVHTVPQEEVRCRVPAGVGESVNVTIANGVLPGLRDTKPLLSYTVGPAPPTTLTLSNIGATHTTLNWRAPTDWRDAITTTAYVVQARRALSAPEVLERYGALSLIPPTFPSVGVPRRRSVRDPGTPVWVRSTHSVSTFFEDRSVSSRPLYDVDDVGYLSVVGDAGWTPWRVWATLANVTVATLVGLEADSQYQFRLAAVAEDTVLEGGDAFDESTRLRLLSDRSSLDALVAAGRTIEDVWAATSPLGSAWQRHDMYNRRPLLNQGSAGPWSNVSEVVRTLPFDFAFDFFDANNTLNHGPWDNRTTEGPLGEVGGEGHFGLVLVGHANVAGCNATHSCCDGFAAVALDRNNDGQPDKLVRFAPNYWRRERGAGERAYPYESGSVDPVEFAHASADLANGVWSSVWPDAALALEPDASAVNESTAAFAIPAHAACRLACAATARLRPPYVNLRAVRDSATYAIPTPLPKPAGMGPGSGVPRGVPAVDPVTGLRLSPNDTTPTLPYPPTNYPNGISIGTPEMLTRPALGPCGPALRLTGSHALQAGAAWYARAQQVREGFETSFVFRLSNPSTFCRTMDDGFTNCRSRGGDGFAFVVQNQHPTALGRVGRGQGFDGIGNALVVEFDTWHNFETMDPGENHVSVHTRSIWGPTSANHTYSLGHTTWGVPDLTDGVHDVRIRYEPEFDPALLAHPNLVADNFPVADFLTNGDYPAGGLGQWGVGFGSLSIYLDGNRDPILIVPLNLDATLDLTNGCVGPDRISCVKSWALSSVHHLLAVPSNHSPCCLLCLPPFLTPHFLFPPSPLPLFLCHFVPIALPRRAFVGFTAATGDNVWQVHDVLAWHFTQLRRNVPFLRSRFPAVETNGEGRHDCAGDLWCPHPR